MSGSRLDDVELLSRLVDFDATSRESNLPFLDFLEDYLDRPGIRRERLASPEGDRANLILVLGPERDEDRDGLLLCGHSDVVPAAEAGWESDPFTLRRAGDRLIARGPAT